MESRVETSDRHLLELLRQHGRLGITDLVQIMGVTATAVRQRLDRLIDAGLIAREVVRGSNRGRPSYDYRLTDTGLQAFNQNMVVLAKVLWDEIRNFPDGATRRLLLKRVSARLAETYNDEARASDHRAPKLSVLEGLTAQTAYVGRNMSGRVERLAELLRENKFAASVEHDANTQLPILRINGCPYPELSNVDHDICEVEGEMLSEMLGERMRLRYCRCDSPDGGCVFELASGADSIPLGHD